MHGPTVLMRSLLAWLRLVRGVMLRWLLLQLLRLRHLLLHGLWDVGRLLRRGCGSGGRLHLKLAILRLRGDDCNERTIVTTVIEVLLG